MTGRPVSAARCCVACKARKHGLITHRKTYVAASKRTHAASAQANADARGSARSKQEHTATAEAWVESRDGPLAQPRGGGHGAATWHASGQRAASHASAPSRPNRCAGLLRDTGAFNTCELCDARPPATPGARVGREGACGHCGAVHAWTAACAPTAASGERRPTTADTSVRESAREGARVAPAKRRRVGARACGGGAMVQVRLCPAGQARARSFSLWAAAASQLWGRCAVGAGSLPGRCLHATREKVEWP